ncbi:MAG: sigma-70 family RNA polymerase sigma factor [Clostridia bacterium]|nr:sigma-70 family RNA polymerase sigma factor [Clostridia bacterium]
MDDREIIELFFARSEDAVAELLKKYGSALKKIAFGILNDARDAEECVNDACLAVWNTVPPERPDPLFSYVCRITRNQALKRYRANTAVKRGGAYDLALDELADCLPSPASVEDEVFAAETAAAINRFLGALERESRILFVRRYWYADSIEELAGLFHTSRHNISVRLSRLRKALRRFLTDEGVFL